MSRALPVAGVVLLASLLLAGCAAGGPATGAGDGSGDPSTAVSDTPSDDATDDSGDGRDLGNDALSTAIPSTYPQDDVPLIDDDSVFAVDLGTGWSVILPTDDRAGDLAKIDGILIGKGFTQDATSTTDDGTFTQYSDAKYTVQITGTKSVDYGEVVQYVVILN